MPRGRETGSGGWHLAAAEGTCEGTCQHKDKQLDVECVLTSPWGAADTERYLISFPSPRHR